MAANFRYVRPIDVPAYSVSATRSHASYPASFLSDATHWQRKWRAPSADAVTFTCDFGSAIAPRLIYLNAANFGLLVVERSSDNVSYTTEGVLAPPTDDRVGRIKGAFEVVYPSFRYWRFQPVGLVGGAVDFELGAFLIATAVQDITDGPKPPMSWDALDATTENGKIGGGTDTNKLADDKYLRYPRFGSDVNRRLVGAAYAQWKEILGFGKQQGFLVVEPYVGATLTPYAYFMHRVGDVPFDEFVATFAAQAELEECT